VIGTEASQLVPERVLEHSIRAHTRAALEILPRRQSEPRRGGTRFGFVRFGVPALCGYRGRAIYLDADQLVLADVQELADSLDAEHAVALVQQPEGSFAGLPVEPRNETSVMVLDCGKLAHWDPERLFACVVPNGAPLRAGEIHYRDFMRLQWLDPALIQPLDPRWNHYNLLRDDTKLVHFSHVRGQPWKSRGHPLAGLWEHWLREALAAGALGRGALWRGVLRGDLHPRLLRQAL
jgi:hypothetical protein